MLCAVPRPSHWWYRDRPLFWARIQLEESRRDLLFGLLPRDLQEELANFVMCADFPLHHLLGKFIRIWDHRKPVYFQITAAMYLTTERVEAKRVLTQVDSVEESIPPTVRMKFSYLKKRKGADGEDDEPRLALAYTPSHVTIYQGKYYVNDTSYTHHLMVGELLDKLGDCNS